MTQPPLSLTTGFGLVVLTLLTAACASDETAHTSPPHIAKGQTTHDFTTNAEVVPAYHRLWADCEQLSHAYGRNAAWGLWHLPLDQITHDAPVALKGAESGGVEVRFYCLNGRACIQAGKLEDTPERTDTHTIPFVSAAAFAGFEKALSAHKGDCAPA